MRPALVVALALAALPAAGCSANVVDAATDSGAESLAVLDIRAHHTAEGTADRLDASARFVSVGRDAVDGALELLGLGWSGLPSGSCTAAAQAPGAPATARVDLRDLSPVSLGILPLEPGASGELRLEPRAFPDVAGLVSGVVFVAPSSAPLPAFGRVDAVSFSAGGRLITGLELPELPTKVRLLGAVNGPDGVMTVDAAGFDILATLPKTAMEDRLELDVVRSGVVRARCGFERVEGKLRLDATALGGSGEVSLVVRSQRRMMRPDPVLGLVDARLERLIELRIVVR